MATITRHDYLKLLGLLTLAAEHNRQLLDIERAACQITGQEFQSGSHTGDAVYSDRPNIGELLDRVGLTVEDDA